MKDPNEEKAKRRVFIAKELLQTEKVYVHALNLLKTVFYYLLIWSAVIFFCHIIHQLMF
jgi:hypothetical protein